MLDLVISLGTMLLLLGLGFFVGKHLETKHFEDIRRREKQTLHVPVMNFGSKYPVPGATAAQLVTGSVVISSDYFKTMIAGFINLVGGRVVVYESLLERARREAILRMKEEAIAWGATQIVNVRMESATIGGGNNSSQQGIVSVEIIAYGTGIR
jgi:uncharacterized protein YbjQ (UPF0145 family)